MKWRWAPRWAWLVPAGFAIAFYAGVNYRLWSNLPCFTSWHSGGVCV